MNANERFECMAEQFYKKTGMLAPGKDCPAGLARGEEDINEIYKEWAVFTEAFHANLFQTHADMYEMLEKVNQAQRDSDYEIEHSDLLCDLYDDIESLLKRARGE